MRSPTARQVLTGQPVIVGDNRLTAAEFEKVKIAETIETREGKSCRSYRSLIVELADTLTRENRYSEAEKVRTEVLTIRRRVSGPQDPDTLLAMESLGITLSYEKQFARAENLFQEALQTAQRSSEKGSLATAWYSFACGAAIARQRDRALEYLGKAAALGSPDVANMANDEDLKVLRSDPRFTDLIAHAKTSTAVQTTN